MHVVCEKRPKKKKNMPGHRNVLQEVNSNISVSETKRKKKVKTSFNKRRRNDDHSQDLEIEYGLESDLHTYCKNCPKQSRHKEFIPIQEFTVDDLPEKYRNITLFNLIKSFADLVVRIKLSRHSLERGGTENETVPGWGSGWVSRVGEVFKEGSKKVCPCQNCRNSQTPVNEWAEIIVYTAKHVIFDTEEALDVRCDLFYTGGSPDTSFVGSRMKMSDSTKDTAEVTCVTHDLILWEKLKIMCELCDDLNAEVRKLYFRDNHKLVVIVSHPHGQEKHVSIGKWKSTETSPDGDTQYLYTTPTCTGSSGAPVFILGRDWCHVFSDHPHHGSDLKNVNLNKSGFGPS